MAESAAAVMEPTTPADAVTQFMERLPLGGRTGIMVGVGAMLIALTAIIWFATRPSYQVLFSGLPETEAGRVVEYLVKANVPYNLGPGNSIIEVPADRVYDLRLEMATQGLPKQATGIGFEIFDKSGLVGMTDFMQRTNYQRALQGELARTIESIAAVNSARVHIVMPKRSLFVSEEKKASASVVMELTRPLQQQQIDGIVHLVSASVEGLEEGSVILLDHKGNLVAGGRNAPDDGRMPADESMALQREVEKSLETRAQAMLDKVIGISASGVSKSIIRITAELDLSRVERQEERFDPEQQVPRSEQTTVETSQGVFGSGGIPGVRPNDANDNAGFSAGGSNQSRSVERETINYEISKTVNKVILPVGTIKRLSVAVLVDGVYKPEKEGEPPTFQERPKAELERLQKIVEQSVGFRGDRGDSITMDSAPFQAMPEMAEKSLTTLDFLNLYKWQILLGMVVLFLLYQVYVMVEKLMTSERTPDASGVPAAVAALEAELKAEGVGHLPTEQPMRQRVPDRSIKMTQQMINDHVEEAREIVRSWLAQD